MASATSAAPPTLTPQLARERATAQRASTWRIFWCSAALAALPPSVRRVAELAAAEKSDKQIAATLGMPLSTVRTYARRIYARVGVKTRVELAKAWPGSQP